MLTDRELLACGAQGDREAFGRLFDRHARAIRKQQSDLDAITGVDVLARLHQHQVHAARSKFHFMAWRNFETVQFAHLCDAILDDGLMHRHGAETIAFRRQDVDRRIAFILDREVAREHGRTRRCLRNPRIRYTDLRSGKGRRRKEEEGKDRK